MISLNAAMTGATSCRDGVSCRSSDMSCPFGTARCSLWDTFLADFWCLRNFSKGNATMISVGFRARAPLWWPIGNFNNLRNIRSPDVVLLHSAFMMPALFARKASDADAQTLIHGVRRSLITHSRVGSFRAGCR